MVVVDMGWWLWPMVCCSVVPGDAIWGRSKKIQGIPPPRLWLPPGVACVSLVTLTPSYSTDNAVHSNLFPPLYKFLVIHLCIFPCTNPGPPLLPPSGVPPPPPASLSTITPTMAMIYGEPHFQIVPLLPYPVAFWVTDPLVSLLLRDFCF